MRIIFSECSVDYTGRLDAHLPQAKRVVMVKADGSVLIHSDGGSYKPLNWMSAPCRVEEVPVDEVSASVGVKKIWKVIAKKTNDQLLIRFYEIFQDVEMELGVDPGLIKDGVEAHLQELFADQVESLLGAGWSLIRREYQTPIGPVDVMVTDPEGNHVAVEIKRRGEIDGVEQLTRYLELLGRDPLLKNLRGIFAAQEIKPQAKVLAKDRGIECLILDYQMMRGSEDTTDKLF